MARHNHQSCFRFLTFISFHAAAYLCNWYYFRDGLLAYNEVIPIILAHALTNFIGGMFMMFS